MFNKIFLPIILLLISVSGIYSQSGWVQQPSGITTDLYSVHFINPNTGWTSGDNGRILQTVNGGINWLSQNSTTSLPLYSIMFADESTGWAVGGLNDNNPLCDHLVIVLKTTNGGAAWLQQISGTGYLFNDLFVVNNQTAYVCNAGICCPPFCIVSTGSVLRTTSSGQNWSSSITGAGYSVFFLDINNGWALTRHSSDVPPRLDKVYRTSNAGNNWQLISSDTNIFFPRPPNLMFVNELTGYLARGSLLKTTNGGLDWEITNSISTSNINYHFFINEDTGWCSGATGKIIRTDNGGTNWNSQISNTASSLNSIYFIDKHTGWIAGSGGTILKTIAGGLTSINQSYSSIFSSFELKQNYPNPFNPTTVISYQLAVNSIAILKVFDVLGKELITLVNEKQNAGSYAVDFSGEGLPSGVYFYKLETEDFTQTKRMILLK
ncbi:MAG: T9SS type A sorting domain-containing protein [Bacteroidota bacterium]|nr:T9SS type A sorting domain-containing protein [Bacteroidota bacterium]